MLTYPLGDGARLGPLEPWQAAQFAEHIAAIREHLTPWIPFATRVVDEESARELLQRFADQQARDSGRIYGIWLDRALAGGALFKNFDVIAGSCEIGVWLAPQAQGRGLVNAAVRAMIDWAVRVRGLHRVEWHTDPNNARSRAAAKRLGLRPEGVLRSSYVLNGQRHDTEIWAILADEWLAAPVVTALAQQPAHSSGPAGQHCGGVG